MRALLLVLVGLVACEVPRTQLMIGVITDVPAPDTFDQVTLTVKRADGFPFFDAPWTITGAPSMPENLPGSYGVYSEDGDAVGLDLTLVATKSGETVVRQTALVSLVPERTLFFRMGLTAGCTTRSDCASTETCVEGTCRDRTVDSAQLPAFAEELVTKLSCTSNTAYLDTATGAPMERTADAAACPAERCREGTCLEPVGDGGGSVVIPPGGGEDIVCSDPVGDACGSTAETFCACAATCNDGLQNEVRCEGGRCTCRFGGEETRAFDSAPMASCFDTYGQCPEGPGSASSSRS
jgi:hypothetical protein